MCTLRGKPITQSLVQVLYTVVTGLSRPHIDPGIGNQVRSSVRQTSLLSAPRCIDQDLFPLDSHFTVHLGALSNIAPKCANYRYEGILKTKFFKNFDLTKIIKKLSLFKYFKEIN